MQVHNKGPEDAILIQTEPGDSHELTDIAMQIMPEWLELFARKNKDYGNNAMVLGERGQFADIWRKMAKLKKSMWDGEQLQFEDSEEIVKDLIGHLFLTLRMMRVREEGDRLYVYNEDDAAVDGIFRMVGGDASKAYQLSYALTPPFAELVRARASKAMEDDARAEMAARSGGPEISLETATERLREAGMSNAFGEPLIMSRPQLLHHAEKKARLKEQLGRIADHLDEEQLKPVPLKVGDVIASYPVLKAGERVTITGLQKGNGEFTLVKATECNQRGEGFIAKACTCHDNEGNSIRPPGLNMPSVKRPLRDDDPVHIDPEEILEQDEEVAAAEIELSDLVDTLTTTPEQQAELKAMLDKMFKASDEQRELFSKFERKVRGY